MKRVNALIAKQVISVVEGKMCGYVLDLVFDENLKMFEGCLIADDENEGAFFLKRKDIFSCENDVLMIESESALDFEFLSSTNNPIGKSVYDEKGVFLGCVKDVATCGKIVKKIITNKCEIPQK